MFQLAGFLHLVEKRQRFGVVGIALEAFQDRVALLRAELEGRREVHVSSVGCGGFVVVVVVSEFKVRSGFSYVVGVVVLPRCSVGAPKLRLGIWVGLGDLGVLGFRGKANWGL